MTSWTLSRDVDIRYTVEVLEPRQGSRWWVEKPEMDQTITEQLSVPAVA